ncbi:flagellar hook-associated protein 2 [Virgibacillus doumboii]|uniref:flagellar hook-associated protein 2 n=1 Tax=Virgibacillus doumboii TaxID=2697503 RepID=UPI0013E0D921|nr:flagellar hook-associated protein 2 [Virgibacillus doumboii]
MRIGGLATGMDIDKMVNKLMKAERMPLQRMEQERTTLTWKRDAFRDVNKKLLELDNMILNMKFESTYNSKSVSSSQESAVTATGSAGATNGTYKIEVGKLATSAINVSDSSLGLKVDKTFRALVDDGEVNQSVLDNKFTFYTYDENGNANPHTYDISEDETINDVLKRITEDDNNVRAFYDANTEKVIMETTRTGNYNQSNEFLGAEIGFTNDGTNFKTDNGFLMGVLNMKMAEKNDSGNWVAVEKGGEDAKFKYNGLDMTSHDNSYELGGVTFQFNDVTDGAANLTVTNNVDASFDQIMKFVEKYNEVVEKLNGTQQEEIYRDYKPLTDKQKEAMSENEIELWEEKAKSGILRGESAISEGLFSMRRSWYANVDTGGDITSLTQVGITTSKNYLDGGKLKVDEQELKEALRTDPDGVHKLFSNNAEGDSRGIINRLEDALESTKEQIERRAGEGTDTLENYTLGKRMKDLNERIEAFEDRLVRVENRYWSQFTQMEKAIQRMNQQSAQLMSQFGG